VLWWFPWIALVRHGRRAAASRSTRRAGRYFPDFGLRQQSDISGDLAHRAGDDSEPGGDFPYAIALGVPGEVGDAEAEVVGKHFHHPQSLFPKCGERASGSAQLHDHHLLL